MAFHSFLNERIVCEMKSKQDSTVCPYSPMKSPSGGMGCVLPILWWVEWSAFRCMCMTRMLEVFTPLWRNTYLAIPIEFCEGQFGSLSHQSTPKRRDSQHHNQPLLVNRCWHLAGVLSSFPLLICSRSVWDHSLLAVFSPRHRQASHRCSCLWGVVHQ